VSHGQLLFAIVCMILLEVNHLKWIWWTQWDCGKHARKHEECGCGAKWLMFL